MEKHLSMIATNPALRRRVIGWGLVATLAMFAFVGIATQASAQDHRALPANPSSATRRRLTGPTKGGNQKNKIAWKLGILGTGVVPALAVIAGVGTYAACRGAIKKTWTHKQFRTKLLSLKGEAAKAFWD